LTGGTTNWPVLADRYKSCVSGSWNLENDTTNGQTLQQQGTAADRQPTNMSENMLCDYVIYQVNAWQAEWGSRPTRPIGATSP